MYTSIIKFDLNTIDRNSVRGKQSIKKNTNNPQHKLNNPINLITSIILNYIKKLVDLN